MTRCKLIFTNYTNHNMKTNRPAELIKIIEKWMDEEKGDFPEKLNAEEIIFAYQYAVKKFYTHEVFWLLDAIAEVIHK